MRLIKDQLGRFISKPSGTDLKVISLVPSQTELLYDLGLDREVVGITKFCIHPKIWFKEKLRVGGTKTLNLKLIDSLDPNLIIANKEENVKEQVEYLSRKYNVWVSDIRTLEDALFMISQVSELVNSKEKGNRLIHQIKENFSALDKLLTEKQLNSRRVAYLIWFRPMMSVGGDTFINNMLSSAGFDNVFADRKRYPEISIKDLKENNVDYILLSSEPFPFREKHITIFQEICPNASVRLVDGQMFSWYGSRLVKSASYFCTLQ